MTASLRKSTLILMGLLLMVMIKIYVDHSMQTTLLVTDNASTQQAALMEAFKNGLPPPPIQEKQPGEKYRLVYELPKKKRKASWYKQQLLQEDEPGTSEPLKKGASKENQQQQSTKQQKQQQQQTSPHLPVAQAGSQQNGQRKEETKKKKKMSPMLQRYYDQRHKTPQEEQARQTDAHPIANLNCQAHGGPDNDQKVVQDMVYWRDIASDAHWKSPHTPESHEPPRFLTFEPDEGGFNNIRMAFEVAVVLAISTGRVLVLPPEMNFYLLTDPSKNVQKAFGFSDFYDLLAIAKEHAGLTIVSFDEFLQQQAMTGKLLDRRTGRPTFPPQNRTNWNGAVPPNFLAYRTPEHAQGESLWHWIRRVTWSVEWSPMDCVAVIPSAPGAESLKELDETWRILLQDDEERKKHLPKNFKKVWAHRFHSFDNNPTPVNASTKDRLAEILAQRESLCVYNDTLQQAQVVHLKGEQSSGHRMLVHFYAFLFLQDWKQDLWMKRFVRDHLRYHDDIQCAAARIVQAVRSEAASTNGNPNDTSFHTLHVRRGDFQFDPVRHMTAEEILENVQRWFTPGKVLYIATDERNTSFFEPFYKHYKVFLMRDYNHLLEGIDSHYLGMIDQLVAAQGDVFTGVFFSTFTGYINRIRGYFSQKRQEIGWDKGELRSYNYVPNQLGAKRKVMLRYQAVEPAFWQREFPVAWRDLDHDVDLSELK